MLAELGADVIKVEDPRGGDPMRQLPPLVNGRGIYDLLLNRGKKSVALDLRHPESTRRPRRTRRRPPMSSSRVFGRARRGGSACPASSCAARIRRLIHCAITGYGQTGPYAERPGHDLNYVAVSGCWRPIGRQLGELPRMFIADVGGGAMTSVIGILAALVGRERHGEGATSRHLDARRRAVLGDVARRARPGRRRRDRRRASCRRSASTPATTSTRPAMAADCARRARAKFWVAFCDAIGRPDLGGRHATDADGSGALLRTCGRCFRPARATSGSPC